MIRLVSTTLLALCLVLTSLSGVVAQTRMATTGAYCGTGAPQILLDASGLPVLDTDGAAIEAPECPLCTLAIAISPLRDTPHRRSSLRPVVALMALAPTPLDDTGRAHPARAPPVVA